MTSVSLNYPLETLYPNILTLGVRVLPCEIWGDTICQASTSGVPVGTEGRVPKVL